MPRTVHSSTNCEPPVRVVVVDDQPLVVVALTTGFVRDERLDVVGDCRSIEELEGLLASAPVDVVLLDVHLGARVVDVALYGALCRRFPNTRFVRLSGQEVTRLRAAPGLESTDCLSKGMPLAELIDAVVQAAGRS